MQYSVSPFVNPIIFGGKPMEKRSTPIPRALAMRKCPSSCAVIRRPRTMIKDRVVVIKFAP